MRFSIEILLRIQCLFYQRKQSDFLNFIPRKLKQPFKPLSILLAFFILSPLLGLKVFCQVQNAKTDSLPKLGICSLITKPLQNLWLDPTQWVNPNGIEIAQDSKGNGLREEILQYSLNFLGIRYRSSGKSPKAGFDCSGFTGFIFRKFGLPLKSSSIAQAKEGKKVPVNQASVGDLAFFGRKGRKGKMLVNHAAIVISNPGEPLSIIHSASNKGIVITKVEESRYWKNSLLFVRNVL